MGTTRLKILERAEMQNTSEDGPYCERPTPPHHHHPLTPHHTTPHTTHHTPHTPQPTPHPPLSHTHTPPPPTHTTTTTSSFAQGRPCLCVRPEKDTSGRAMEDDRAGTSSAAKRRRDRRLRAAWRHEQLSVKMIPCVHFLPMSHGWMIFTFSARGRRT